MNIQGMLMRGSLYVLLLPLSIATAIAQARPAVPMCDAEQLSLSTGGGDDLNGMSHGGTYLMVKNVSPQACRLSPMPSLTMLDEQHKPLKVQFQVQGARGMHPGPVVLPVVLAAGGMLTSALRWVSGPVFGGNGGFKLQPAFVALQIEKGKLRSKLSATMYGESETSVMVDMTRFQTTK